MSFQGDVGGIGLAELLQSLARGRREGVLTLNAGQGSVCTLGLESGVLYLLPDPGEDASIWKERARQAWVERPDHRLDAVRTSEIARAHRIERLYSLLDSEGVHFRFDPRALPGRSEGPLELTAREAASATQQQVGQPGTPQVYCEGVSVEYLLLEYARMSDEASSFEHGLGVADDDVPCPTQAPAAQAGGGLYAECDGRSNVVEIADRLAVPMRQARLMVAEAIRAGGLRTAVAREQLELALDELHEGRIHRAGARLTAWARCSPPGPCDLEEARAIEVEWLEDRLAPAFNRMPTAVVRRILRRVDHALDDPETTLRHWRELQRLRRHDGIVELHRISCELRLDPEEESPSLRELLEVSRGFRELGRPRRAAAILRIAADRNPTSNAARLDIGVGLVAAGMVEEGAPWVIETARALIEAGAPEKALGPLRTLIEIAPDRRDARRLVIRARNITVRRQLIRRHSAVGLAVLIALALGAWVQIHVERRTEREYEEVTALLDDPVAAQELFDRYFREDDSERALTLGALIRERRREIEHALRTEWYERYREAQGECMFGDAKVGLQRALEIPNPPVLITVTEPWPLVIDIFNGLAARMEGEVRDLGEVQVDDPRQVEGEEALRAEIEGALEVLPEQGREALTSGLRERAQALLEELERRAHQRTERAEEIERLSVQERQELLYQAARAHANAGDLERAIAAFEKLFETDPSGKLREVIGSEYEDVRARHDAAGEARKLAEQGRHEEAIQLLEERLDRPESVPLPWKLETYPEGAKIHMPDGSPQYGPLKMESRIDERVDLKLELLDHRPVELTIERPGDQFIWLSRLPERTWRTGGRVEALPVAVAMDHIVCDRAGHIARLAVTDRPRWERQLGSLGGVARAPVFLSQRNGFLLTVTEDGEAWIIDARTGDLEGPWDLEVAPLTGPIPTPDGARVTLRDGRVATWTTRVKPDDVSRPEAAAVIEEAPDSVRTARVYTSGLDVLRAPAGGDLTLRSRFTGWTVSIRAKVFLVEPAGAGAAGGFAVERHGEWYYLAWEQPNGMLPNGRLWVSDGAGLRSYVP